MMRGVDSTYEELFAYACPKFITAAPPNLDVPGSNTNQVPCSYLLCLLLQASSHAGICRDNVGRVRMAVGRPTPSCHGHMSTWAFADSLCWRRALRMSCVEQAVLQP